jgi:tripartite-type tricarboxylate transporter receptor subunit TctC
MIERRRFLQWLAVALGGSALGRGSSAGAAQDVTALVIGYPAGRYMDAIARMLAGPLRELLGGSVVVDNRVGASGRRWLPRRPTVTPCC